LSIALNFSSFSRDFSFNAAILCFSASAFCSDAFEAGFFFFFSGAKKKTPGN
jgi:hypothetical protein